jgi:hypothetical protein
MIIEHIGIEGIDLVPKYHTLEQPFFFFSFGKCENVIFFGKIFLALQNFDNESF